MSLNFANYGIPSKLTEIPKMTYLQIAEPKMSLLLSKNATVTSKESGGKYNVKQV